MLWAEHEFLSTVQTTINAFNLNTFRQLLCPRCPAYLVFLDGASTVQFNLSILGDLGPAFYIGFDERLKVGRRHGAQGDGF